MNEATYVYLPRERYSSHTYAGYAWIYDDLTGDSIRATNGQKIQFRSIASANKRARKLNRKVAA
jgi:hypothetical protein